MPNLTLKPAGQGQQLIEQGFSDAVVSLGVGVEAVGVALTEIWDLSL